MKKKFTCTPQPRHGPQHDVPAASRTCECQKLSILGHYIDGYKPTYWTTRSTMDTTTTHLSLTRLLTKLDHTLLQPSTSTSSRLRHSQYERNRVNANLEHARTLLLTLEKQSSTIRVQSQRQSVQADLQRKREVVRRLQGRLLELQQLDEGEEGDGDSDDSEEEEGEGEGERETATYGPAHGDTESGLEAGGEAHSALLAPTQQTLNELRSRRPLQASDNRSAASTSARESLFAGRPTTSSSLPADSTAQTETLLSHNRLESSALSDSLIGLAQQLKSSALQFQGSLAEEREVLKRAEGGLDSSAQGMEAAERRMGMLRRMSEGQGWWGRVKLYAFIAGLWVAAFLLVFVGPKLRF